MPVTTIPFVDFGGSGPLVHFAHANGYPPPAYVPLLEQLTPRYHVIGMLARPLWPGSTPDGFRDWSPLPLDLVRFLDEQGLRGILGVGHSMGGVATLGAALQRPELFRAVVLIDPVIFHPRRMLLFAVLTKLGLRDRVHPLIQAALRRRRVFAGTDEMFERYRRAAIFRRIDDRGLRAYVEALARPRPDGGVELAYPPEWEIAIYRHGPYNLWGRMGQLQAPMLVIRGAQSDTFLPDAERRMARLIPHARFEAVEGTGHLVPLERPGEVAQAILSFLKDYT